MKININIILILLILFSLLPTKAAVNDEPVPVLDYTIPFPDPIFPSLIFIDSLIIFDASASYSPDGSSITSYEWDWNNDGLVDNTGSSIHHTFSTKGFQTIKLTVRNSLGAVKTITKSIFVSTWEERLPDTANLSYSPANPIAGIPVRFYSGIAEDDETFMTAWFMQSENSDIYTLASEFDYVFKNPGTYWVELYVPDPRPGGRDKTTRVFITVAPNTSQTPTADLTFNPSNPTVNQTINFDGSGSTDADGTIASYAWDFNNDGVVDSAAATPSRAMQSAGTHVVKLTVTDNKGTTNSVSKNVIVSPAVVPNQSPVASFTFNPSNPTVNQTINFDGSGSTDADGAIASYAWDFNNDGVVDSAAATPSRAMQSAGTHVVKLTVTDNKGTTNSVSKNVIVSPAVVPNQSPVASFTFNPSNPTVNQTINFDGSGSTDADGTIASYAWDFNNDGVVDSAAATPSRAMQSARTHVVKLTVTDNKGTTNSVSKNVIVSPAVVPNQSPVASFTFNPSNPTVNQAINFDGSGSTDADGAIASYAWDFNNDGVVDQFGQNVSKNFQAEGNYTVRLTVYDAQGNNNSIAKTIIVYTSLEEQEFSYSPQYPETSTVVSFDASKSYDPTIPANELHFSWDFDGDSQVDAVVNSPYVTHTYTSPGRYVPVLTIDHNVFSSYYGYFSSLLQVSDSRFKPITPLDDPSFSPSFSVQFSQVNSQSDTESLKYKLKITKLVSKKVPLKVLFAAQDGVTKNLVKVLKPIISIPSGKDSVVVRIKVQNKSHLRSLFSDSTSVQIPFALTDVKSGYVYSNQITVPL